jgi:hypothetical protein
VKPRFNLRTIAVLGLVLALGIGGTATAAKLITSKDIKNGTIKTADLSKSAKRSLKGNSGLRGATGAQGPQGAQGAQGPAGPSVVGQSVVVSSPQVLFGDEIVQMAVAFCPPGHRVVSGGGASISDEQIAVTRPTDDRSGWGVIGVDLYEGASDYVQATAICAPAGQAVAASAGSKAQARRTFAKLAAKFKGVRR